VNLKFRDATRDDVPVIAALQNAAAGAQTARFGVGHWSTLVSERSATLAQRHARAAISSTRAIASCTTSFCFGRSFDVAVA